MLNNNHKKKQKQKETKTKQKKKTKKTTRCQGKLMIVLILELNSFLNDSHLGRG